MRNAARVTIERLAPTRLRIAMRESGPAILIFAGFVVVAVAAAFTLMPEARAEPAPLVGILAVALGWALFAWSSQEEYVVDHTTRSLTVFPVLRKPRELRVPEISSARVARTGYDDDRLVVELVGSNGKVLLRLPRLINTLTTSDQLHLGLLLADHLGIPLQGREEIEMTG